MPLIKLQAGMLPADLDDLTPDQLMALDCDAWAGQFNTDTAEKFLGRSDGETVWRTPSGRWVYTGGFHDQRCYMTVDQARAWLAANDHTAAIATYIDVEHDSPGQLEIGPEVKFRIPAQVRDALDALAARNGISRAAQLRSIVMDSVPLGIDA